MQVAPYLFFNGRCEEAIAFYRQAIGAEVQMLMHYGESPQPTPQELEHKGKVMHAAVRIGDSTVLFSDGHCQERKAFENFGLTLTVADEAEARRVFTALSQGGQVHMPLEKTFFSPSFGMLADRFGVLWMVYVSDAGRP